MSTSLHSRGALGRALGGAACVASLLAFTAPALAGDAYPVGGYTLELPQAPLSSLTWQGRLYVALGHQGVAIFELQGDDGAPKLVETRAVGGEAFEIALVGGSPWVMLREARALPLAGGAPAGMASGGASAAAPLAAGSQGGAAGAAAVAAGAVISGEAGLAIIDSGRAQGIQVGDWVRVFSLVPVEVDGIDGGDGGLVREVVSGVGQVSVLGESQSQVALTRGGRATAGDRYEVGGAVDIPALVAPERLPGLIEAGFDVRPFLAVGTLGLGTLNEVWGSYTGQGPWFAELRLQPVSAGWSREGNLLGMSTTAMAGYDNRFFGIGLGGGITVANTGITQLGRSFSADYAVAEDGGGSSYSVRFDELNRAGSIAQVVRLGAVDGLHLELRNTFVVGRVAVYEAECLGGEGDGYCDAFGEEVKVDEYREIRLGSIQGKVVVPVVGVTDLVFEGGGGATGFAYGAGGVQTWVKGNGDAGSLGLRVSAGYGWMGGEPDEDYINLNGPLLSFGMRWRI